MIPKVKTPPHPNPPPLIRVSGTHREMGQQIGEACKKQVQHSLDDARNLLADAYEQLELTWEGAQIQARKYIPFAQERYQQYVNSSSYGFGHLWADMWCAAFVWKKTKELP